ncbi:MAG TPA: phosphoglucosamine mutase [Candidatus Angelobacter sp.]|nr:phosphoglucosamine mutase [Candidatus Angelobacter sp.]
MRKLFGTDGIRGVAGEYPLDKKTIHAVGHALGDHLSDGLVSSGARRVIIGQDTRESSGWIADALAQGLAEAGVEIENAGVITTPGVAYLARVQKFSAGVVISASHNPWQDNGIKVFGGDGYKLPDHIELEIEKELFALLSAGQKEAGSSHSLHVNESMRPAYIQWLARSIPGGERLKLVVDCANGAAAALASEVFSRSGLSAEFINNTPNGRNINENCGALHPNVVARETQARQADLGICFDGDADRVLFADADGKVVDGDAVLLLLAREMKRQGGLATDTVVATTMSNMGLEIALRQSGVRMLRAQVGDKYVLEEMRACGAVLGGEQSGHIILSQKATTGDGLLTALMVVEVLARAGKPISSLIADLKVFPQVIKNVRVRDKQPLAQIAPVQAAIEEAERDLNGSGRVVVRYSGTEALARVMIEAESREKMEKHADSIVHAIRQSLGS